MPELKYNKLEDTPSTKKKTRGGIIKVSIHQEREKKFTKETSLIDPYGRKAQSVGSINATQHLV